MIFLHQKLIPLPGQPYDDFVEAFVSAVVKKFPSALLQWEDFSKNNASRLLERYRDRLCTFNDDIQGTGAVTLAGLLAAMKLTRSQLSEQRVAILGAGSSAIGISDQIVAGVMREGLSESEARSLIWLVDSCGLVHSARTGLEPSKQKYAQPLETRADWQSERPDHFTLGLAEQTAVEELERRIDKKIWTPKYRRLKS